MHLSSYPTNNYERFLFIRQQVIVPFHCTPGDDDNQLEISSHFYGWISRARGVNSPIKRQIRRAKEKPNAHYSIVIELAFIALNRTRHLTPTVVPLAIVSPRVSLSATHKHNANAPNIWNTIKRLELEGAEASVRKWDLIKWLYRSRLLRIAGGRTFDLRFFCGYCKSNTVFKDEQHKWKYVRFVN